MLRTVQLIRLTQDKQVFIQMSTVKVPKAAPWSVVRVNEVKIHQT